MELYKTIQGDTWDAIAFKVYGDEKLFPLLIKANPSHIQTMIFVAGIVLQIPSPPEETIDDLPPWKRGDEC